MASAAFQRWFRRSQVVDRDGQPLRVYHGSQSVIDRFDRIDGGNLWGRGYYFAESPVDASLYATDYPGRMTPRGGGAPNVTPVYLSMQNGWWMQRTAEREHVQRLARALGKPVAELYPYTRRGMTLEDLRQVVGEQFAGSADATNEVLRRAGYDGIVGHSPLASTVGGRTFLVWDPTQAKSVFNRGTWDRSSPLLLHGWAR